MSIYIPIPIQKVRESEEIQRGRYVQVLDIDRSMTLQSKASANARVGEIKYTSGDTHIANR